MNTTPDKLLVYVLTPFSWLFRAVTEVRNKLFDWGWLKSVSFDVPVVCVGNLSVGGTGKTPHVEYIVGHLMGEYRIGVLSRGYKRKTKGFLLANSKSTPELIGDEPYQIYEKFGKRVRIAVCENRVKGIRRLLEIDPKINLIILDDAFQHRQVTPKVSILLMDYSRPVYDDKVLPLGRLREDKSGINRAEMVVVTKCPDNLPQIQYRILSNNLNLMTFQKLFFSRYKYEELIPVFPDEAPYQVKLDSLTEADSVLIVTGIANPRPLIRLCMGYPVKIKVLHFPDHHNFTQRDLRMIEGKFHSMKGARKIILTTEKDGCRMLHNPYFPVDIKPFCFALPVQVEMIRDWKESKEFLKVLREEIDHKDLS